MGRKMVDEFNSGLKATETFQYAHLSSCHPPGVKKGLNAKHSDRQFLSGVISAKIMFQIVLCTISNFSYWQSNSFLNDIGTVIDIPQKKLKKQNRI